MSPATLDAALRELGSAPVVEADLDELEARLFAAIGAPATPVALAGRRRRRVAPFLIGAVAACLLALVVLAAGWFAGGDDPYVLAAAVDVEVVLPDGDIVTGEAGLVLPVGTVLNVGGSMEIAGVVYGPGDYVITDDGPVAADDTGGGRSTPDPRLDEGDNGGGAPGTSTTVPVRPDVAGGGGGPTTTVRPPAGGAVPPATDRPVGLDTGDTRPTTTASPWPTTTAPRDPPPTTTTTGPPRVTTTSSAPRDTSATTTAPRDPPPRDTTTTGPARDRP